MRGEAAFARMTRIKAGEREYGAARLAVERLRQQAVDNPDVLTGNLRFRDLDAVSTRLEGTHMVRLFSEFETGLRHFLKSKKLRVPQNAESLIDKVRDRVGMAPDLADDVHAVREYRNTPVHSRLDPAPPVTSRNATKFLSTFLSWLQRTW